MPLTGTLVFTAKKWDRPKRTIPRLKSALVAGEGFEPSTFGLCTPLQLSLPGDSSLWSGLSLHPRTGFAAVRMPAIKSLHLLAERVGSVSLARDYPATGFPEFDR